MGSRQGSDASSVAPESPRVGLASSANRLRRALYNGASLLGVLRPSEYSLAPLTLARVHCSELGSQKDYVGGCTQHVRCIGHICRLPSGTYIMPHFVNRGQGKLRNSFIRESERAWSRGYSQEDYNSFLCSKLLTKRGILRYECMGGTIDGSLRAVIVICWEISQNEICIPRDVASNMRFPTRICGEADGLHYVSPRYQYRELKEGDVALVVRPPSLWHGSCQPMRVVLWDRECVGLSPYNCRHFNADFDGDEVQVYPLGEPDSIRECLAWSIVEDRTLTLESSHMLELPSRLHSDVDWLQRNFMIHSTLSVRQIADGARITPLTAKAGVKPHCAQLCSRMPLADLDLRGEESVLQFYSDSRLGVEDIMNQQLTQGEVGRITRLARLGCMRAGKVSEGKLGVSSAGGSSSILLCNAALSQLTAEASAGLPCLRAVSAISKTAQQSALDSHKATSTRIPRFDCINSLLQNTDETLVILRTAFPRALPWHVTVGELIVAVCSYRSITPSDVSYLEGAYHPNLLSLVAEPERRYGVCIRALELIASYYKATVTASDLACLSSYLSGVATPGTGMLSGSKESVVHLRWLDRILVKSYSELSVMEETALSQRFRVCSLVEGAFLGRFDVCM